MPHNSISFARNLNRKDQSPANVAWAGSTGSGTFVPSDCNAFASDNLYSEEETTSLFMKLLQQPMINVTMHGTKDDDDNMNPDYNMVDIIDSHSHLFQSMVPPSTTPLAVKRTANCPSYYWPINNFAAHNSKKLQIIIAMHVANGPDMNILSTDIIGVTYMGTNATDIHQWQYITMQLPRSSKEDGGISWTLGSAYSNKQVHFLGRASNSSNVVMCRMTLDSHWQYYQYSDYTDSAEKIWDQWPGDVDLLVPLFESNATEGTLYQDSVLGFYWCGLQAYESALQIRFAQTIKSSPVTWENKTYSYNIPSQFITGGSVAYACKAHPQISTRSSSSKTNRSLVFSYNTNADVSIVEQRKELYHPNFVEAQITLDTS